MEPSIKVQKPAPRRAWARSSGMPGAGTAVLVDMGRLVFAARSGRAAFSNPGNEPRHRPVLETGRFTYDFPIRPIPPRLASGGVSAHAGRRERRRRTRVRGAGESGGAGRSPDLRAYGVTLAAVAAALGVALLLQTIAGLENVDLVFLPAVIAVAVRYGLGPSLVASVASVLAYNFFFIPPLHAFEVADPKTWAALGFFLVSAIVPSHLAARVRSEALAARHRAEI